MKRPRTLTDLKNDPRVDSVHQEDCHYEGKSWWCYLKAGWQDSSNPTCHTIHEKTLKEVCDSVHFSVKYPNDPELKNA
jgi:hypothetical protein